MSAIRFVHADFLRLGTPLSGLADSPSWLQQLAMGSVRQAVRNLIDLAVSRNAAFVLIAGAIADDKNDIEPAARWLNEQLEVLRKRGVSVVTVAQDADTRSILDDFSDVVLHPGQSLQVTNSGGSVQLNVVAQGHRASGGLLVTVGDYQAQTYDGFVYQARPSRIASADCSRVSSDHRLSLSAGAVQAVAKDETQEYGCIVVEADFAISQLRSEFCVCDVVRYRTEAISLSGSASVQSLVSEIVRACASIDHNTEQTVVVDWILQASVAAELQQIEQLNETQLLSQLREQTHAGHRGIWPRRVSFSNSSMVSMTSPMTPVLEEYTDLLSESVHHHNARESNHQLVSLGLGCPAKPELLAGLTFLSRVA